MNREQRAAEPLTVIAGVMKEQHPGGPRVDEWSPTCADLAAILAAVEERRGTPQGEQPPEFTDEEIDEIAGRLDYPVGIVRAVLAGDRRYGVLESNARIRDAAAEVIRARKQPPHVPATPALRCLVTDNPCGTDAWMVGAPCGCVNCTAYVRALPPCQRAKVYDFREVPALLASARASYRRATGNRETSTAHVEGDLPPCGCASQRSARFQWRETGDGVTRPGWYVDLGLHDDVWYPIVACPFCGVSLASPQPVREAGKDASTPTGERIPINGSVHDLKCWPASFAAILAGIKRFEWRNNDRNFQLGDVLHLREWHPHADDDTGRYTGHTVDVRVTHMITAGFGIPDGYCIMSIELDAPATGTTASTGAHIDGPIADRFADALEYARELARNEHLPRPNTVLDWDALLAEHAASVKDAPVEPAGDVGEVRKAGVPRPCSPGSSDEPGARCTVHHDPARCPPEQPTAGDLLRAMLHATDALHLYANDSARAFGSDHALTLGAENIRQIRDELHDQRAAVERLAADLARLRAAPVPREVASIDDLVREVKIDLSRTDSPLVECDEDALRTVFARLLGHAPATHMGDAK